MFLYGELQRSLHPAIVGPLFGLGMYLGEDMRIEVVEEGFWVHEDARLIAVDRGQANLPALRTFFPCDA